MTPTEAQTHEVACVKYPLANYSLIKRKAFIAGANWYAEQLSVTNDEQDDYVCCGRCDGVNDVCFGDMSDEERAELGIRPKAATYGASYIVEPVDGGLLVSKPEKTKEDNL